MYEREPNGLDTDFKKKKKTITKLGGKKVWAHGLR